MNLSDYKKLSHDELAYICLCREPKSRCQNEDEVYSFLAPYVFRRQEHFFVISTNVQHQVVDFANIAIGSDNHLDLSPRDVFRNAILANAHQIILAHNHPSGCPDWSADDISTTAKLVDCGRLIGIPVVDHILIYNDEFINLASQCDLYKLGTFRDSRGLTCNNDYTYKVIAQLTSPEGQLD